MNFANVLTVCRLERQMKSLLNLQDFEFSGPLRPMLLIQGTKMLKY